MEEIIPVAFGCILGFAVWHGTHGWLRSLLLLVAVFAAAFAATVLSGEYQSSWLYLLLDVSLAAMGIVVGIVLTRLLPNLLRRGQASQLRR